MSKEYVLQIRVLFLLNSYSIFRILYSLSIDNPPKASHLPEGMLAIFNVLPESIPHVSLFILTKRTFTKLRHHMK